MAQYSFGSGTLLGVNNVANSTPINFGALQDASIDFSFNIKELYGQYQFPLAVGRGTGKISGKAKFAQINGLVYNSLFFGLSQATGQLLSAFREAGSVPASPAYTITVANGATFDTDLGVVYANTGLPFTKVASGPTIGQYSVNSSGVYTFAAADASAAVLISYTYTFASSGNKVVISNQLLGTAPTFQVLFREVYNSQQFNLKLNACVSSKLSFASKLEDFMVPEFDFMAFADAAGNVGTLSLAE